MILEAAELLVLISLIRYCFNLIDKALNKHSRSHLWVPHVDRSYGQYPSPYALKKHLGNGHSKTVSQLLPPHLEQSCSL